MDSQSSIDLNNNASLKAKLTDYGSLLRFESGDVVLNDQEYIKGLPIVLSGNVRVMRKDEDGKELLLYYIKSGESCVMSFIGSMFEEKSQILAIADDEVELLFIPNDKVRLLQKEDSLWLEYIFRMYHQRFEELLSVINSVAFKKLDQRIVDFLQKKKEISGSSVISITHQLLAEELGSERAVISRLLKQLEKDKAVELGRNKIVLL